MVSVEELCRAGLAQHIVADRRMLAGMRTQLVDPVRVRQKAHVHDHVGVHRQAVLESERLDGDAGRRAGGTAEGPPGRFPRDPAARPKSTILVISWGGRLSATYQPRSSSTLAAVPRPAPDKPVTRTTSMPAAASPWWLSVNSPGPVIRRLRVAQVAVPRGRRWQSPRRYRERQ